MVDWRVWGWRSNVLGTRLEFWPSQRRPSTIASIERTGRTDGRAKCGLDHGLLSLDPFPKKVCSRGPHSQSVSNQSINQPASQPASPPVLVARLLRSYDDGGALLEL